MTPHQKLQSLHADARLIVHREHLKHNWRLIRDAAQPAITSAVVKSNGYGLGVEVVSRVLYDAGCRDFFVATLDEALELRSILSDVRIYIFHGLQACQARLFIEHQLIPVLNHRTHIAIWKDAALQHKKPLPAILHIDTGMNRLGLNMGEAQSLAQDTTALQGIKLEYIMSHLACINEVQHDLNTEQLKRFNRVRKLFPKVPACFANSYASLTKRCYHFDMVRPGAMLYGINKTAHIDAALKQVATLDVRIIQLREIEEDGTVGYGATQRVHKGQLIAVVPVGYADGYLRSLSNKGKGWLYGVHVPLLGRVSMDMTMFDVTALKGKVQLGDRVELLGEHVPIDSISEAANTIGYEILTRLGGRFERITA